MSYKLIGKESFNRDKGFCFMEDIVLISGI